MAYAYGINLNRARPEAELDIIRPLKDATKPLGYLQKIALQDRQSKDLQWDFYYEMRRAAA